MKTKYAIIIPDGAADEPLDLFDGKTVIEAADTPNIDHISTIGRQGLANTVPDELEAGSDVAMMSLLGYDPMRYYSGRAPLEAVAQDIKLGADDWVFRCNLVTTADDTMIDHSAGHISTDEACKLVKQLGAELDNPNIKFYTGVSYRHLTVVSGYDFDVVTQPPHDMIGGKVSKNLPKGKNADVLKEIMAKSARLFEDHEINKVRMDLGENPVSTVWFWGQGKKAMMESFEKRFGITGATITAVDLVRGISKLIGFDVIEVPGATGYVDTNFEGKAAAAIKALEDHDLVFVHVETPDEAGHSGNAAVKKQAVELIDKHVVGPVHQALKEYGDYRILVMPDHYTPVRTQAHCHGAVPFAMAGKSITGVLEKPYSEENAAQSGFMVDKGYELMEYFLKV